jgi:protein involved in polysaccharide export with SLBB domain
MFRWGCGRGVWSKSKAFSIPGAALAILLAAGVLPAQQPQNPPPPPQQQNPQPQYPAPQNGTPVNPNGNPQTGNPNTPNNQYPNSPENPNNPNGQNKNPQQNQMPSTSLSRAQGDLAKIQQHLQASLAITLRNIVVPPVMVGDTVTFTVNAYDRRTTVATIFQFALSGQPAGAYLDLNTGIFTWQPQFPGQYSFYVWAADSADYTRQANEQITITVNPALEPYGYSIFQKARAVIDTRLLLLKSGLLQGVGTINNGQFGTGMPLTPGAPPQVAPSSVPNPFSQFGSNSAFSQGQNSYLFGPGGNNQGAALAALQAYSQGGQLPGGLSQLAQNYAQGSNQFSVTTPFQPPISPFGNVNNILPQQNNQGNFFNQGGSFTQSMAAQQLLSGNGGAIGGGLPGALQGAGQGGGALGQLLQQGGGLQSGGSALGNGGQGLGGMGQGGIQANGMQGQNAMPGNGMQGQNGFGLPSPTFQGFGQGGGGFGLTNGQTPFSGLGSTGLSVLPSSPFANLQSIFTMPQSNGLPAGQNGLMANALQYLVGPQDEMGMNVYLPYPERYQLGPGDMLSAQISSDTVPASFNDLTVDQQGRVMLPGDDQLIVVRGQTLAMAQNVLERRVKRLIKGGQLVLTLKALRTMSIQILGDAYQTGNYQVPAVATLFNTLMICGGPNNVGSLRTIQLRRNNGSVQTFDLYDYLTTGKATGDAPLQPGDVIFIPPVKARVNIKGEVERPAIYETVPGDTVAKLIKYAGGVTAAGYTQKAELDTENSGTGHIVKDVDLTDANAPAQFFDQDTLIIYTVPTDLINELTLKGAVKQPGLYEYHKGITVADIVRKGGGLLPDTYTARADLNRRNPDKSQTLIPVNLEKALSGDVTANLALEPHDELVLYTNEDVKWVGDRTVTVLGSVQRPGSYQRNDGERVADLLLQAGGTTSAAYKDVAILQQAKPDGTPGPTLDIDLNKLEHDPSMNVLLNDHDTLTVQSDTEAHYVPDQVVKVLGAVQQPNVYTRGTTMTLRDAIQEAGGLKPNAGKYIEIEHARVPRGTPPARVRVADLMAGDPVANVLIEAGDQVTVPEDALIHMQTRKVVVLGRVANPGPYPLADDETISQAVAKAGGLLPDAFKDGAQLYRNPEVLKTDSQTALTPLINQLLHIVDADEYQRAMASADWDKARAFSGGQSTQSIPFLSGSGSASQTTSSAGVPLNIWLEPLVTAARDITAEITPTGNVGVNLAAALSHKGSPNDLEMEDQDIIIIPKTPSTVSVVGAVAIPSAILYTPGKTVRFYLSRAGGFTDDAAKDRLILIHPGGLVQKANMNTTMQLGDQLLVPSQVMRAKLNNKGEEIDAISKQITAGLSVLAILKLIGL